MGEVRGTTAKLEVYLFRGANKTKQAKKAETKTKTEQNYIWKLQRK